MKTLLMALMAVAVTRVVLPGEVLANEEDVSERSEVMYEPEPAQGLPELSEIASTTVTAPERVAWNRDGTSLYIVSMGSVSILDVAQNSVTELMTTPFEDTVLDVSSSGTVAIMRNFDSVVLREAHDGKESAPLVAGAAVSSASFSPDGSLLALVLDNGSRLQLWDVAWGEMRGEHTSPSLGGGAFSVTFAPSSEHLTWYSAMGGQTLHIASGQLGPFITFAASIYDVQMCRADALVAALDGGTLTVLDPQAATEVQRVEDMQVFSSSCTAASDELAVTTESSVGLLDLSSLSGDLWLPIDALDAELSPSGERLAVVGVDGEISVWQRG